MNLKPYLDRISFIWGGGVMKDLQSLSVILILSELAISVIFQTFSDLRILSCW